MAPHAHAFREGCNSWSAMPPFAGALAATAPRRRTTEGTNHMAQGSVTQNAVGAAPLEREQTGTPSVAIAMYCVLLASYILMAADRYLFPVIAPAVRREFGLSPATTGLLTTIFTLGLGVGGLTTGYILSRFPRRAV